MFGKSLNLDKNDEAIETMLSFGVVKSIDFAAATVIVEIDEVETPPIEWLTRAGALNVFAPPSIGEQVLVASINGDLAQSVVLGGIYSNSNPACANSQKVKVAFQGTEIEIALNGEINISAPKINLIGDLNITGKIDATGIITSANDLVAAGKSLKSHRHNLVKTGTDISGLPQ